MPKVKPLTYAGNGPLARVLSPNTHKLEYLLFCPRMLQPLAIVVRLPPRDDGIRRMVRTPLAQQAPIANARSAHYILRPAPNNLVLAQKAPPIYCIVHLIPVLNDSS